MSKTDVLGYVDHISVLLARVLNRACEMGLVAQAEVQNAQEDSRKVALEMLDKPEELPDKFVDFLNKALRLTVAYNEYTRFIWHLRKISKKYMAEFYPEMLKPEVFEFIRKLLGLSEYVVPQVEDPEIVDLYTIFSFDHAVMCVDPGRRTYSTIDGMDVNFYRYFNGWLPSVYEPYSTIGGCLCRVNELIWGLFRYCRDPLKLVVSGEIPDPFDEWKYIAVSEPPKWAWLGYPDSYEVLSMIDEHLPAIFVGRVELVKEREGRRLYLVRRW
ncbi:MAG: hypothetical protein ACTSXC_00035 [Candidatus Freyarchaeota archaeon]